MLFFSSYGVIIVFVLHSGANLFDEDGNKIKLSKEEAIFHSIFPSFQVELQKHNA